MTNIALLRHDPHSKKWVATFRGQTLLRSPNKTYITNHIKNGTCTKAKNLNVTAYREIGSSEIETGEEDSSQPIIQVVDRFNINDRFGFLEHYVAMVADRTSPSLMVTGEGGIGKTHTVGKALKDSKLQELDLEELSADATIDDRKFYIVIKGYSSAKGLYRALFENRNRIIVFDDCDSILKDANALNLLKGSLDSYEKRTISWRAEGWGDDDLPRSFEFKGGVIFISNMPKYKVDQAVRTRCITVDLSMSVDQKIERMHVIVDNEEFMPEYTKTVKKSALKLIEKLKDDAAELSLRTLIQVTKVAGRGIKDWEKCAEYLITAA